MTFDFKTIRFASFLSSASLSLAGAAVALTGLGAASGPAFAETASQVARDSYAPPVIRRKAGGGLTIGTGGGQEAPQGADKLTVTPSGLAVEGGLPELASATAAIEARIKGHKVTGADLFAAARDLEAAYANAGYVLTRVTLPPQTVKNGAVLKLVVTGGYVESVDVSALPGTARSRVQSILEPLVGKTNLTRQEIERRLLLAGDTPGVSLKSTLKAGAKPGATVIVVDGRYDPVSVTSTLDNSSSRSLGVMTTSTGVDVNNALGLGEVFYVRVAGYPGLDNAGLLSSDPRNRQIAAGLTLPIGTDGWWLGIEGLDSRTHPTSTQAFTIADRFQRLSTTIGYSWLRSRDGNLSTSLSFDAANEDQTLVFGATRNAFTSDRTRVLRLTQSGDIFLPWQAYASGNISASFGMNAFGARFATTALPLSRDGASPVFQKLTATGRYSQALADGRVQVSLAGIAQTGFGRPLVSSQQLGLGGFDWLSAYDGGALQGDNGAALRAELSAPMNLPDGEGMFSSLKGNVAPYAFAALGITQLMKPATGEFAVTRAAAFGGGLRFGLVYKDGKPSATLTLEYARGASPQIGTSNRFNIKLTSAF